MCFWTHFVGLMGYLTIIELVWAGKDAVLPQIFPYLTVLATPSGTHISSNFPPVYGVTYLCKMHLVFTILQLVQQGTYLKGYCIMQNLYQLQWC